ncbi:phage head-binding domain-containing protein [Serratia odorifera]|uniref:phage head-binding domain-containing protein n=1 Tax=Serratia odorifera TaxID=618 RepID=UPI00236224E4|nr:phage head-binding domain-containing protein [Serratia odorifera]
MADTIIPNVVVSMPSQLFTLARAFKAAANGRIYIGKIDTDPTIPENQIQVYLENENENEDGTHVPIAQPIIINSGGYPVYGGQIAKFVTIQGHSMAVYDAYGAQQFYFPNVLKYDPDQLRTELAGPGGAGLVGTTGGGTVQDFIDNIDDTVKSFLPWVTPEMFGAKGDGSEDDTVAFNAALATGHNVWLDSKAVYKITSQLIWPWLESGEQILYGHGATISTPNLRTTVFGQRLADNTVQKTTIRKSYIDVTLNGPVTTKDIYAEVNGTDGFYISYGNLVRCKTIGYTTGVSVMGHATVQSFYADNMRNAAVRSEGVLNRVFGLMAGWTAGDTLIIKSDYSYYADIYAEYAGVIPNDTQEPGPQQGSLISFAQDGQNAGGNVVNGAACRYYGAGAITVNGFENHVGGTLSIGRPADTTFAAVDRYDPAIYIAGTNCSIGDVDADRVYGGVHLHNNSVNCRLGMINLGTISDLNNFCQAFVASGTCTNCKVEGIIASGVAKVDSVFISMSDLHIGMIRLKNVNLPSLSSVYPVRIGGACIVDVIDIEWNSSTVSTSATLNIAGNSRCNRIQIIGAVGTSIVVNSNVAPVLGDILLNPRSDSTTRCAEFASDDGLFSRRIASLTVIGTTQPRANGTLRVGAYVGSPWLKINTTQPLSVYYPEPVLHTI